MIMPVIAKKTGMTRWSKERVQIGQIDYDGFLVFGQYIGNLVGVLRQRPCVLRPVHIPEHKKVHVPEREIFQVPEHTLRAFGNVDRSEGE